MRGGYVDFFGGLCDPGLVADVLRILWLIKVPSEEQRSAERGTFHQRSPAAGRAAAFFAVSTAACDVTGSGREGGGCGISGVLSRRGGVRLWTRENRAR